MNIWSFFYSYFNVSDWRATEIKPWFCKPSESPFVQSPPTQGHVTMTVQKFNKWLQNHGFISVARHCQPAKRIFIVLRCLVCVYSLGDVEIHLARKSVLNVQKLSNEFVKFVQILTIESVKFICIGRTEIMLRWSPFFKT